MKKHFLTSSGFRNGTTLKIFFVLFLLIFIGMPALYAQRQPQKVPVTPVICPAKFEDMHTRVNIPEIPTLEFQKSMRKAPTAQFDITFGPGAEANPEAKAAFQFALDIWANEIVSAVPIKVSADFATLGNGVLASAGPTFLVNDFPNTPEPGVLYPIALANSIAGQEVLPEEDFDLVVNLGNSIPWYYGTDGNTPPGLFDFVTIALHEIGHGLGFTTTRSYTAGAGSLLSNGLPAVYSLFMIDGDGNRLLDLEDGSNALGDAFTGGDLFVDGPFATAALAGSLPELYAPNVFAGGSSLAHWDEVTFPAGDPNSLMTPQAGRAESNFDIGAITRGHFKDMGWVLNDADAPPVIVTPGSFSEVIAVGETISKKITISNITEAPVSIVALKSQETGIIQFPGATELAIDALGIGTLEVAFNTTGFRKGVYEETIILEIEGRELTIDVPVSIRVLDGTEAPIVSVAPESFTERIEQFQIMTKDLIIENAGDAALNYSIIVNGDDTAPNTFNDRVQTSMETIKTKGFEKSNFSSIQRNSGNTQALMTNTNTFNLIPSNLYATDFDTFTAGDINTQEGWVARFDDNWVISDANPFGGTQHLRGISDGLGSTRTSNILAFSPLVTPGNEPFMVFNAKVNIQGTGVTWEVIPQSPAEGSVVTRLRFKPDGTLEVLTTNGFVPLEATVPVGYFNLRISVDKDDSTFSIFFDEALVFRGPGSASIMEQVVFLSNMEIAGPTFDIDNLEIIDGDANAFFLSVAPSAGIVPLEDTSVAKVKFDTRSLAPGVYKAAINVNSDDETNPSITIPVSLTVVKPPTITVAPQTLSEMVDVKIDNPPVKTASFIVSNTGESLLEFEAVLGATSFTPSITPETNSIPISELDLSNYGVGNTNLYTEKLSGRIDQLTIAKNTKLLERATTFTDSIFYDSGIAFPSDFSGVNTAAYTSAVKFDAESNFVLTAVRNGYQTETAVNPVYILEIYKGGATPVDGELLLTQTFNQASPSGVVVVETLDTSLSFTAGESFWVVHKYPADIPFPQGVDDNATQRPNTYFFSSDSGTTYNPSGFVFFVRALSGGGNANYITLEPSSGSVAPGESTEVSVSFDGTMLTNGIHSTPILLNSNDPVTPTTMVATTFEVSGQVSEIVVSEELLLFNDVFLGTSRERKFTISNTGLAQLNIFEISSDNQDFSIDKNSGILNAGEELDLTITFSPSTLGSANGIISIASDAPNADLIELVVNGVGVSPPIAVFTPENVTASTEARTTVDTQIMLRNDGDSPLIYSFPDLAVASALAKPDIKLNNTDFIAFEGFDATRKEVEDTRVGAPVFSSVGTDINYGYTWIDSDETGGPVYNFTDITESGTTITLTGDGTEEVILPFTFDFYGTLNNRVFINANGFIAFQNPTGLTFANTQIPVATGSNNLIAALWDDLEPQNFDGSMQHQSFDDRFIVQWTSVSKFLGSADETVTFQIVLYVDGNIDIFYEDVETAPFLNSTTVGIENPDGTDGAQVVFNSAYIKDGLALRFVKPTQPLTSFISNVNPLSGVIPAGGAKTLIVTLDASNLNDGLFFDELVVSSNAPDKSASTALFELTVIGTPQIEVITEALEFEPLFIGLNSEASILLKNIGTKALEIADITNTNSDFILDVTTPGTILPDESLAVFVKFTPTSIGTLTDTLVITSNDAFGNESISIPISGIGVDPPIIEATPEAIALTLKKGESSTEIVSIKNVGASTLNYSLSKPVLTNSENSNLKTSQHQKLDFPKIRSKEVLDTRVGLPFLNASGGPDTFGYTWIDNNSAGPAYDYIDISTTGTLADVGSDGNETVALPFGFNFFGETQNEVTIGANGFLTFAPLVGSNFSNLQIPNAANPNLFIAALWDDLEPQNGGGVFYQAFEDYFVVQYEKVPAFLATNDSASFQVILFPDGSFKLQYEILNARASTSSTIGIEGPQGLSGLQVVFNSAFLTNELAITFTPPIMGTLEPGATVEIPVEIATIGLKGDETYTGDIKISSNDPIQPEIIIPVTLDVLEVPEILSFTILNGVDEVIGTLNDGDVIDIRDHETLGFDVNDFSIVANSGDLTLGSVVFDLDNVNGYRIENVAPYSLGGDRSGDFTPVRLSLGSHTVSATPYLGKNGSGEVGAKLTVNFMIVDGLQSEVTGFTLINASINEAVGSLKEGDIINLVDYETNSFNIVAETGENDVRVVVFDFNGVKNFKRETIAPYALNGDFNGVFKPLEFPIGMNTITATPSVISTMPGKALTVNFEVVNDVVPAPETSVSLAKFHPNPVEDIASFSIANPNKGVLKATLLNLLGYALYQPSDFTIDKEGNGFINMNTLAKGTYILRIESDMDDTVSQTVVIKK